jgi:hypothetical protein
MLVADAAQAMQTQLQKLQQGKSDPSTMAMFFVACVCALLPLDISQMSFAILGAILYAMLQNSDHFTPKKPAALAKKPPAAYANQMRNAPPRPMHIAKVQGRATEAVHNKIPAPSVPEVRKASVLPIAAPTFQSRGWDAEVQELLLQITPTAATEEIVNQLASVVGQTIKTIIPEVEMFGFASGNLNFGKAFGVAVPEVDIVATVSPQALFSRLHAKSAKTAGAFHDLDEKKAPEVCNSCVHGPAGCRWGLQISAVSLPRSGAEGDVASACIHWAFR